MHPHIAAILPRGEAIRNFVYSRALDYVAEAADLSVFSVIPNAEIAALLSERYGHVYELRNTPERWPIRVQREILDMAHGRWLWSEAARERWELRDREATTPGGKLKRALKKAACYPFANRQGLEVLSRAERLSSRWLRPTDQYLQQVRSIRPSLVFNGSHVHSLVGLQTIQAAQWLGIPTAAFIFSWDNLTSQGRILPPYDYYLVWNEDMRRHLLDLYRTVRPERVIVTGTPQFDCYFRSEFCWSRQEFCARMGLEPARPIILYTTGMSNHMPGEEKIVEGIADVVAEMKEWGPPQLFVRVNPKDVTGRFGPLRQRRKDIVFSPVAWEPNWQTPQMDDMYVYTNSVRHADVGINITSTVTLELCMLGKPTLNIGYNPPDETTIVRSFSRYYSFDHYRPVTQSGAVAIAYSPDEVRGLLDRALSEPEARRDAQRELIHKFFGPTLDGGSGRRVADALLEIAGARIVRYA